MNSEIKNEKSGRLIGKFSVSYLGIIATCYIAILFYDLYQNNNMNFDRWDNLLNAGVLVIGIVWGAVGVSGFARNWRQPFINQHGQQDKSTVNNNKRGIK